MQYSVSILLLPLDLSLKNTAHDALDFGKKKTTTKKNKKKKKKKKQASERS